jgi:hypothetical protein
MLTTPAQSSQVPQAFWRREAARRAVRTTASAGTRSLPIAAALYALSADSYVLIALLALGAAAWSVARARWR